MRVLWLIAAVMQLAAVTLYYTAGLFGFAVVQIFVLATATLTVYAMVHDV